ncbi:MAG: hypothetical protein KDC92_01195 [Bacteroidetes bacterium]|nr:hypothetical protein [Bacteroidota bacterium]
MKLIKILLFVFYGSAALAQAPEWFKGSYKPVSDSSTFIEGYSFALAQQELYFEELPARIIRSSVVGDFTTQGFYNSPRDNVWSYNVHLEANAFFNSHQKPAKVSFSRFNEVGLYFDIHRQITQDYSIVRNERVESFGQYQLEHGEIGFSFSQFYGLTFFKHFSLHTGLKGYLGITSSNIINYSDNGIWWWRFNNSYQGKPSAFAKIYVPLQVGFQLMPSMSFQLEWDSGFGYMQVIDGHGIGFKTELVLVKFAFKIPH